MRTHKYGMRYAEIIVAETNASGHIKPVAPSESRPDAAYQVKPEKRSRYQGGGDSRWQMPQKRREPKPSTPPT